MSYIKDLGRVKGDKGTTFKPSIVEDTATTTKITWIPAEDSYIGPIPDDIIIQKSLIVPVVENNVLSWYQANNNPEAAGIFDSNLLPSPVNIKGEKGDTGNTKINIEIYENLDDIPEDSETSTLYYIGNDNNGYAVYVYDPNYANKYRKVGLSSIDLSDYYTKSETNTKLKKYATIEYVDDQIALATDLIDSSIIPKLG